VKLASPGLVGQGNGRKPPPPPKRQTETYRKWGSVNLTDARTDIDDAELFWAENAITIGKGSIQILPGPGAPIIMLAQGIASLWGFTLNGSPIFVAVGLDGSLTQVTPGGVMRVISGAGSVSTLAHLTIWQGTTVLIIDPVAGYSSWNGVVYTVLDATLIGEAIAVFEGRVWIAHNRKIEFTAPNSFSDRTVGNGAGAVIITDEAFVGNITTLLSALEQLWIFSAASVEALSNVTASGVPPSVVTTFALTNIITGVGAFAPSSVLGYLRAIAFMSPGGGIYALSGVTPQQLSEKIDAMFPALTLTPDVPAAVGLVQGLFCLLFLVTYTQANAPDLPLPANGSAAATPLVIGFTKGKIFFASQSDTLRWITTLVVNGVSQVWGADGAGHIFQLFGASKETPVLHQLVFKLYSFGRSDTMKALMKLGLEVQSTTGAVDPVVTVDSDLGSQVIPLMLTAEQRMFNSAGVLMTMVGGVGVQHMIGGGQVLSKDEASMFGHYLGVTIKGTDPPYRIQALQMEYVKTREWDSR
jgi:hypothetical protein